MAQSCHSPLAEQGIHLCQGEGQGSVSTKSQFPHPGELGVLSETEVTGGAVDQPQHRLLPLEEDHSFTFTAVFAANKTSVLNVNAPTPQRRAIPLLFSYPSCPHCPKHSTWLLCLPEKSTSEIIQ